MKIAKLSYGLSLLAVLVTLAGCSKDGAKLAFWRSKADSIATLNTQLKARSAELQQASVEKDTLITTMQNAMMLAGEIDKLQKEVVARPARNSGKATDEGVITWDAKVRSQINDIRRRHRALTEQLARANARLKEMTAKNAGLATNFEHALQTIEELQARTAQQASEIRELAARLGGLEKEKSELVAVNRVKADSIEGLVSEKNRVYWIAGTKDSLRKLGVIKQQGGKSLLLTRVGETFTPGDGLNPALFTVLDKSHENQLSLPDKAEYEIVSPQNVAYAEPVVPKKRRVKSQFVIKDPRFWETSKFLILLRR